MKPLRQPSSACLACLFSRLPQQIMGHAQLHKQRVRLNLHIDFTAECPYGCLWLKEMLLSSLSRNGLVGIGCWENDLCVIQLCSTALIV